MPLDTESRADTNEREYKNPANWRFGLYASKKDSRIVVPKRRGIRGYTVNFAKPLGIGIHVVNIIALTGIVMFVYIRFFAK